MSTLVESRYGEKTSAKDILSEFVPAFVAKIHEKRAYEEVLTRVTTSLKNGEILFASRSPRIDNFLTGFKRPLPWQKQDAKIVTSLSGALIEQTESGTLYERLQKFIRQNEQNIPKKIAEATPPLSDNWAYPVFTSLSGNKSDRFIERTYVAETSKLSACAVLNSVTFTHKHTFKKENEDEIRSYLDMIGEDDANFRNRILTIEGK